MDTRSAHDILSTEVENHPKRDRATEERGCHFVDRKKSVSTLRGGGKEGEGVVRLQVSEAVASGGARQCIGG
jgi:hypothetical protein